MPKAQCGSDQFTIRIPDDLRDEMLNYCKKTNRKPSSVIRDAIRHYLGYAEFVPDEFNEENTKKKRKGVIR